MTTTGSPGFKEWTRDPVWCTTPDTSCPGITPSLASILLSIKSKSDPHTPLNMTLTVTLFSLMSSGGCRSTFTKVTFPRSCDHFKAFISADCHSYELTAKGYLSVIEMYTHVKLGSLELCSRPKSSRNWTLPSDENTIHIQSFQKYTKTRR